MSTRIQGRLIDTRPGEKVFAYACGRTFCQDAVFEARLVSTDVNGVKRFAASSECRHPRVWYDVQFIGTGCETLAPVSDRLLFILGVQTPSAAGMACWTEACPSAELTYDGAKWVGSLTMASGTLGVEISCLAALTWQLKLTGACITPNPMTFPLVVSCHYPWQAGYSGPATFTAGCCDGEPQSPQPVTMSAYSYTRDRRRARLVSAAGPLKIFAGAECCRDLTDCPIEDDCCGCEVSPREWSFSVAGVANGTCATCTDFNSTWSVVYKGGCLWTERTSGGICTPGTPWTLACSAGTWTLSTSNIEGAAVYTRSQANWLADGCFGPHTLVRTADHTPRCSNFPATVTLTAV